jgi:AcrR family transcriptional regulator
MDEPTSRRPLSPSAPAGGRDAGQVPPHARTRGRARQERYRPLPAGTHGIDPAEVKRDQSERLQKAIVELIAAKGYGAVRVADVAKLARVSPPTFYSLYRDKEDLLLSAYDEIAARTAHTVTAAYSSAGGHRERLHAALAAFAQLAREEPQAMSLQLLGAFGAGRTVLARRRARLERLEAAIRAARRGDADDDERHGEDLTVRFILGGIREVTAARLQRGEQGELPALAEQLTAWALLYPATMPAELAAPPARRRRGGAAQSARARRAEGRLPRGRSELPRELIVKSQRERIVDATAAVVAESGLARLTVPAIARRANVSMETFYAHYASKHDAFLGAQKVGLHQALTITGSAYESQREQWPRAVAAGLRALLAYLSSEPEHAHLILVDTFAASPDAIAIRGEALRAFAGYLEAGASRDGPPAVAAEAVAGGAWQVLHHYIERRAIAELPRLGPQLMALALTPFLGAQAAVQAARDEYLS